MHKFKTIQKPKKNTIFRIKNKDYENNFKNYQAPKKNTFFRIRNKNFCKKYNFPIGKIYFSIEIRFFL